MERDLQMRPIPIKKETYKRDLSLPKETCAGLLLQYLRKETCLLKGDTSLLKRDLRDKRYESKILSASSVSQLYIFRKD